MEEVNKETKGNKIMHNQTIQYRRIIPALLMALTCVSSLTAQTGGGRGTEGGAIVGLWNVHYFQGTVELFQTYDQWHSDGLEFEVNSIHPGAVCQGTWKQTAHNRAKLLHVIWTFDTNGVVTGHIEETQANTVSQDGNTYQGTFVQKFYDLSGNFLFEVTGTLTATRLSVQ
ncbi:MAG: hypothetical protein ACR2II_10685 [Chthoniobacterales bacterium]